MKKIILIGGIPGTGKTTLAYELALINKIDKVISIDTIKASAQCFISNSVDPYLYTTTHEAYTLERLSVIDGYKKHCQAIWKYLLPVIQKTQDEKCIIVEGAQIHKEFLTVLQLIGITDILYVNLYIHDEQQLKDRYHMKEKIRRYDWIGNLDNILTIQQYLLEECGSHNIDTSLTDSLTLANTVSLLI